MLKKLTLVRSKAAILNELRKEERRSIRIDKNGTVLVRTPSDLGC